jgi:hypothetical protein
VEASKMFITKFNNKPVKTSQNSISAKPEDTEYTGFFSKDLQKLLFS